MVSVYRTSTVPLARDMQILLLKNNFYTRKLLHNMKILPSPHCHLFTQEENSRIHRLWSCPHSQKIWKFINRVLAETMDSPIFIKEAMLGEYEENAATHRNLTILYTKWYIDQAKREEKSPNLIHFAAALLNVLGAQFEFIQKNYEDKIKKKNAGLNIRILFLSQQIGPDKTRRDQLPIKKGSIYNKI